MKRFKIVADSSSDILELCDADFSIVPLKIITEEREFVDDETLDIREMVEFMASYRKRSSTACPSPQDFLAAFGDAEEILCVTMTSALSACHNSALIAKKFYEDKYPDRKVYVLDSLSTGPEMKLAMERAVLLKRDGMSFDEICADLKDHLKTTALFFLLKSMNNLANNGRVSRLVAKTAGILGIRLLGKASEKGVIEMVDKCRGQKAIISCVFENMEKEGYRGGEVKITHCLNEEDAEDLKKHILKKYEKAKIEVYPMKGLCGFYAELGGLIIGFEKESC